MKNAMGTRGLAPDDNHGPDDHDHVDSPHGKADAGLPPRGTPKNYLMAWLLVMLKDLNLHGYEIMKALK